MHHHLQRGVARLGLCIWLWAGCTVAPVEPTAVPTETTTVAEATGEIAGTPSRATATAAPALPSDPQEITITATDGQALSGHFYPAGRWGAPVVVLIHWVRGNSSDWHEIAPWLQNRGLANPFANPGGEAWWDATWFPVMREALSYNVFTVSLRGCRPYPDGCPAWDRQGWIADIQGTLDQVAKLEGVDATRVVAIGSSIGADGAADGCAWMNEQQPGVCRGALSLSPGDHLGIAYSAMVQQLSEAESTVQVWCVADEREVRYCRAAGEHATYRVFEVVNGGHGNQLLSPDLDPLPMQLVLDFLQATFGQ